MSIDSKLYGEMLDLFKKCPTKHEDQVIRLGGAYVDRVLENCNWFREQCIESNESNEKMGMSTQDVPRKTTIDDLRTGTLFGRRVEIVEGDEDILEVT